MKKDFPRTSGSCRLTRSPDGTEKRRSDEPMRVLFWGTPEFAAPPLRALLGEGFEVVGVVTQPDRPQGRSRSSLVAIAGQGDRARGNASGPAAGAAARCRVRRTRCARSTPDISVVVAYGHILPRDVIDLPRLGTLNIHASLLPALARRGADPGGDPRGASRRPASRSCAWCPRSTRDRSSCRCRTPIVRRRDVRRAAASALRARRSRAHRGAVARRHRADAWSSHRTMGSRRSRRRSSASMRAWTGRGPRPRSRARFARSIPKPGAFTTLAATEVKLFGARMRRARQPRRATIRPGEPCSRSTTSGAFVACGEGAVRIAHVQPAGKRRLTVQPSWRADVASAVGPGLARRATASSGRDRPRSRRACRR